MNERLRIFDQRPAIPRQQGRVIKLHSPENSDKHEEGDKKFHGKYGVSTRGSEGPSLVSYLRYDRKSGFTPDTRYPSAQIGGSLLENAGAITRVSELPRS